MLSLLGLVLFTGPFLFISFVSVAVFVILNVVIAIIATSYTESSRKLASFEDVRLGDGMVEYFVHNLRNAPLIGPYMREHAQLRFIRYQEKLLVQLQNRGAVDNETEEGEAHVMKKIRVTQRGMLRGREEEEDSVGDALLKIRRGLRKVRTAVQTVRKLSRQAKKTNVQKIAPAEMSMGEEEAQVGINSPCHRHAATVR